MPTPIERRLNSLLEPAVEGLGFELVRVLLSGQTRPTIQVMAERPDRTMSVDDCAKLSRELSAILDVEDPVKGGYVLEVSSPGIDRPLTRPKDFKDFLGYAAKVETKVPVESRRRFKGELLGLEDGKLRILTQEGEKELELYNIEKAKLVLTDDLIKASLKGQKI
jgi:ribosome maturation factor RimP